MSRQARMAFAGLMGGLWFFNVSTSASAFKAQEYPLAVLALVAATWCWYTVLQLVR